MVSASSGDIATRTNLLTMNVSPSAAGTGYFKNEIVKVEDPNGVGNSAYFGIHSLECNREWEVGGKNHSVTCASGPSGVNALELKQNTSITKTIPRLENYYQYTDGDDPDNSPLTGTVATSNGATTVSGTGTRFTEELVKNDIITIGGNDLCVSSITNDTSLVACTNASATVSGCSSTKKFYNAVTSQTRIFMKSLVQYFETDGIGDKIKVQFYDGVRWNDLFTSINSRDVDPRGWHKLSADITPFISKEKGRIKDIEYYYKDPTEKLTDRYGGETYGNCVRDICGGSGRGAQVRTNQVPYHKSLEIENAGIDYRVGDVVCVQMETDHTVQPYAIVREIESENKLRFVSEFDAQNDYFRVADVVVYESDVPTRLGDVFLGKQKTGIGTNKPNNTLSIANKYDSSVALDFRANDSTVCYTNYEDFSSGRILSESLDDNYSGKKLHFQLPTAENTWKSNLAMYNGCVGIGTCFTDTSCLPAPNGTGSTGEGLHVLGNIRQNNSSLLQSSSILDNRHEQTLHFDGSYDHVDIADNANLDFGTNDFSIEVWAKHGTRRATHGNREYLVDKGSAYAIQLPNNSDYLEAYLNDGSGSLTITATSGSILDDKWHHIAFSYVREDKVYMYVDGILVGSGDISSHSGNIGSATAVRIGNSTSGNPYNFEGEISTVRLFQYALSAEDVRSLYNGKPVDYPEKGSVSIEDQIEDHDFSEMTAQDNFGATPKWEKENRSGSITWAWNPTTNTSELPAGYTSGVIGNPTSGQSGSYWQSVIRTNHDNNELDYDANQKFQASFWAKSGANQQSGDADARALRVRLVDDSASDVAQDYAGGGDVIIDTVWRKYYISFVTSAGDSTTRRLEFQVGNSDTPVHLTGVKFTRIGVALELLPEGISSSGGQWYDSSGIDMNGTITNASDKGKHVSPNYGWKTINSGTQSSVFGHESCATTDDSTVVGLCSCALGDNSSVFGHCSRTQPAGDQGSVFGYCSCAIMADASAFGWKVSAQHNYTTVVGYCSCTLAQKSTAIGYKTCTSGVGNSTAIGNLSKAQHESATAVGKGAVASGCYSSSFGFQTTASGKSSVVMGLNSEATAESASAFGLYSCAYGTDSTAVGYYSMVTVLAATKSSVFGYKSCVLAINATAVGHLSCASECCASAFGYKSCATNKASNALGYRACATGLCSLAIGKNILASGSCSTAIGYYACNITDKSIAVGFYTSVSNQQTLTVGSTTGWAVNDILTTPSSGSEAVGTVIEVINATAVRVRLNTTTIFGNEIICENGGNSSTSTSVTTVYANRSTAVGVCSYAVGIKSNAFGMCSWACGDCSTSIGTYTQAGDCRALAIGYGARALCENTLSIGRSTCACKCEALAIGYKSCALGCATTAIGCGSISSGVRSAALGQHSCATTDYSTAFGSYAKTRVDWTTNIGGPIIIKKDASVEDTLESTIGGDFLQYSGVETVLMTKEVDFMTQDEHEIELPTGARFWINEMGIIATVVTAITTQPTISIGIDTDTNKHLDNTLTLNLTAAGKRERYIPASPDDGEETLVGKVAITAITSGGGSMKGRFYFKGLLVENE